MNARRLLIFLLIIAAAALAFMALRPAPRVPQAVVVPQVQAPPPPAPSAPRIVAAGRSLTPGMLLTEVDLTTIEVREPMPENALPIGAFGLAEYRGALVRRVVPRGQALTRDDILNPGERGFLAAVLRPGYRAISIGVDATTGAAGLVAPGDTVDLVLVQSFGDAPVARRVLAETVLTRLRVLAVDQQIAQGGAASAASAASALGGAGRVARTVTLEVTADGAERVAVAEQLGRLAVTVRSAIEAGEEARQAAPVFGSDVSGFLGNTSAQPTPARMTIIQGAESQEVTFR